MEKKVKEDEKRHAKFQKQGSLLIMPKRQLLGLPMLLCLTPQLLTNV